MIGDPKETQYITIIDHLVVEPKQKIKQKKRDNKAKRIKWTNEIVLPK